MFRTIRCQIGNAVSATELYSWRYGTSQEFTVIMHAAVLKYVEQVARLGSIRRASEILHVAASAVNRQIIKLETEIGTPLFERRNNGMHLTPAGDHLVRHIRSTMADWQSTLDRIAELKGDIRGEATLLAIPAFLINVVPRALDATHGQHPYIRFMVQDLSPPDVVKEMRAGRPDLALLFLDRRFRAYDIYEQIDTHIGAVMRADHPLARAKQLTLTECASFPIVSLSDPWILNSSTELEFARSGAQLSPSVVSNSFNVMKQSVRTGLGICFSTPIGFLEELAIGELVYVPLKGSNMAGATGLFVHRQRGTAPHIQATVHMLKSEIARLRDDLSDIAGR